MREQGAPTGLLLFMLHKSRGVAEGTFIFLSWSERGGRGCVGSRHGSAGRRWWFHHWLLEVSLAGGGTDFPLVCPRMVEEELWFGPELGE